jgi:hypothetical protein
MVRNAKVSANPTIVGGVSRLGKTNPFVNQGIIALMCASQNSTHAAQILTVEDCQKQNSREENAGLMLEKFNSASLYVSSGGALDDETAHAFFVALFEGLTDDEVIYRKGNPSDPKDFKCGLSVPFTTTHRLRLIRDEKNVYTTTDKNTGVVSVRNPFGWQLSFIPNEYVNGYVASGATFAGTVVYAD